MLDRSRSMIHFRHILTLSLCMSAASPAAQFGDFTYTDQGETITITDYPTAATGAVVIPATIAASHRDASGSHGVRAM